jgi:hypothetical protein
MQKITSIGELKEAILQLENRKSVELELLKEEFSHAKEKMRPGNIVKNTFSNIFSGPKLIKTVMITTLSLTAAVITKKYFRGFTGRLLGKLLGRII